MLEHECPDVIVLDLLMPDFNGIELARIIGSTSDAPPPIIIHSGSSPDIARIVAREIRPFDIIPKGDSEARLRDAVARALVAELRPSLVPRRL
jgi:CheY-like chemotaxis protein